MEVKIAINGFGRTQHQKLLLLGIELYANCIARSSSPFLQYEFSLPNIKKQFWFMGETHFNIAKLAN